MLLLVGLMLLVCFKFMFWVCVVMGCLILVGLGALGFRFVVLVYCIEFTLIFEVGSFNSRVSYIVCIGLCILLVDCLYI